MKTAAVIFLAILGSCLAGLYRESWADFEEDPGSPGSRVKSISKRSTNSSSSSTSTCSSAFSCQDCKTARVCRPTSSGNWTVVKTTTCAGWCDYTSGTCTDVPNDTCGESDDFICMQESGKFPSASNTSEYHVCVDYEATMFECALDGYAYNPSKQACQDNFSTEVFNCTDKDGLKVDYPSDGQYFAYCGDDSVTVIDVCPDNYKLNTTSQICEPHCEEEGVFAYPYNCTQYVECSKLYVLSQQFLIPSVLDCPTDTGFDSSQFICVSLDDLTSCSSS